MTRRDINVLTFLRQAIEHKLKNPDDIDFNSIRYEKGAIHGGIFNWFKDTIKAFSLTGYPELNLKPDEVRLGLYRYFNIEDPNVQKLFIAELSRLPVLLPFYRPESLLDKKGTNLPDSLHAEIKKDAEAEKSIYDKSAKAPLTEAPAGEPAKKEDKKTKPTRQEIERALAEEARIKKESEKSVQEEKPETMISGKEGGTGTGTAATNKSTAPTPEHPTQQESAPKVASNQPITRQVPQRQREREIREDDHIPEGAYGQTGSLQQRRQTETPQARQVAAQQESRKVSQPTQAPVTERVMPSQRFEPPVPSKSSTSFKTGGSSFFSRIRLPDSFKNAFSNVASKASIGFNKLIGSKIGPGLVTGGLGALGGALLGPSLGANSSIGAAVGGGLGAAAPGFMESGGGNKILSAGNNIANSISNLTGGMARRKASLKSKTNFLRRRAALMFFLMFIGTSFFMVGFGGGGSGNNNSTSTPRAGGGNVGIGTTYPIGVVPQEKLDKIVHWGKVINNALTSGNPPGHYNRMVENITYDGYAATRRTAQVAEGVGSDGIYWCTNLVIDSYNLSGIKGLGSAHQGVRNMVDFWKTASGYKFIPYSGLDSLKQIKPGFVLFRIKQSDYRLDHVSIINEFNIDQFGNGKISTLDSNSKKNWNSTIENGKILETFFDALIIGFGGID